MWNIRVIIKQIFYILYKKMCYYSCFVENNFYPSCFFENSCSSVTNKVIKDYPRIRFPTPTFCLLPWRISRRAPHLDTDRVITWCTPHRVDRTGRENRIRMICRECHNRFMWITTPVPVISWFWPSSVFFLGQDVPLMHSIFLVEEIQQLIWSEKKIYCFHK